ncbi:MAG: beta-ketoacyl-ACP synthase [Rhizobiaceae bacterium]|jgi:3-oxoacyl-[acyl-carrier-protein] synthase II|nr:beta-ketoacyl-ACP synthase [Rhizobiaceae bacterium]
MAKYTDHLGRPVVVVTGMGVVSSLGRGIDENWKNLTSGKSGIHKVKRFSTEGLSTRIAGTVDFMDAEEISAPGISYAMADATTEEALDMAGFGKDGFPGPLFFAAPPVELEWQHRFDLVKETEEGEIGYERLLASARAKKQEKMHNLIQLGTIAFRLAEKYGTKGLPISLSTACASGATALQQGIESIRRGESDAALCAASDGSVTAEGLIRFSLLSALTTHNNDAPERASRPFSKDRSGFVMSEGSAALVLESLEHAEARGATILGTIRGVAEKADSFHRTRSSPNGAPVITAISKAIEDAGVEIGDIDYINAHGTSTPENDRMEYNSLHAVFGDSIHNTPISSNKSMIGHTLTAAGAIEAVFSFKTMLEGVIPPTINYETPDPDIPLDVVPNQKREAEVSTILSNSFGFGGQNACLVFGREVA